MLKNEMIELLAGRERGTDGFKLGMRKNLERTTVEYLEKLVDESNLAQIRAEAAAQVAHDPRIIKIQVDRIWDHLFFKHPELKDHVANRKALFEYALSLSDDGFIRFEHLDEAATTLTGLDRQRVRQSPTTSNLASDEATLQKYCRVNRREFNTAVLNLLRDAFGAGFTHADIEHAVQSRVVNFGLASEEQLAEWTREDAEERQDFLINQATPQQLKQAARQESEQRRTQARQQQAAQQVKMREQAEAAVGYRPLPESDQDGKKIDRAYLLRLADMDTRKFRQLCSFYGMANVTAR